MVILDRKILFINSDTESEKINFTNRHSLMGCVRNLQKWGGT